MPPNVRNGSFSASAKGAVLEQVAAASIEPMHVIYRANATARAALPMILEGLEARGLRAVPVSELLDTAADPRPS